MIKFVISEIESDYKNSIDIQTEARKAILTRIQRLEAMDETLYDDKLSGEIPIDRYIQKHEAFKSDISDLKAQVGDLDQDYKELHDEAVSMIELTQDADALFHDPEATNDEKRVILTKLFQTMTVDDSTVSVKFTNLARCIAKRSAETRVIMQTSNLTNQTFENDDKNRGAKHEKSAKLALYPVWQG
jgi:hypothetical protein